MKQSLYKFLQNVDFIIRTPTIKTSFLNLFGIVVIATVLLTINMSGSMYSYRLGDIAESDIRVPRDIRFPITSETEMKQKRAAESVPLVFDKDASVLIDRLRSVEMLFTQVENTLEKNPPIGTADFSIQLRYLKKLLPPSLLFSDAVLLDLVSYESPGLLMRTAGKILIHLYDDPDLGMLDLPYDNPLNLPNKNISIRIINSTGEHEEKSKTLQDLITVDEMRRRVRRICIAIAPGLPPNTVTALATVVSAHLKPNIAFNLEETRRRINEEVNAVEPVMGMLKKGQTIVREGDTITVDMINKINILNRFTSTKHLSFMAGIFIIQMVFLILLGHFLLEYHYLLVPDNKATIIISSLVGMYMFYAFFIMRALDPGDFSLTFVFLLPIPFVAMLISLLYSVSIALLVSIHLVFFTTILTGGNMAVAILAFSSAVLGIFINSGVGQRTDFLIGGVLTGLANAAVLISLTFIEDIPFVNMTRGVAYAFAHGVINSILALGILPLYENVFGITTRFKLLELSDLNADIFKRMLMKAPGTYNHSLIVSTMAEAACKDINANALLARVGSYYHDIGKIEDAGLYIENKLTDPRSASMTPLEYSQLIISHVKSGIELGRRSKLPESVIDFIKEHHGKSIMTYFYHRALEIASENSDHPEIDKTFFQYPGPKPHNKETAVVMLADAIEAASRSLQDPTPVKLEGLVKKITYNKLNEGELDHSDLSMSEINIIQKTFLRILNGIFHTRIEYPEKEEVARLEEKVQGKDDENRSLQ